MLTAYQEKIGKYVLILSTMYKDIITVADI